MIASLPGLAEVELLGREALDWGVVAVFAIVYLGMFLGGLPRLKLDRSGVALLGAIAVIAFTGESVEDAARAVDLPTVVLLFAFMVLSAQMRLGGFYTAVTQRVATLPRTFDTTRSAAGIDRPPIGGRAGSRAPPPRPSRQTASGAAWRPLSDRAAWTSGNGRDRGSRRAGRGRSRGCGARPPGRAGARRTRAPR